MSETTLPLSQIVRNPDALRQVKKDTEEFQGLVASVRARGVLQAIRVRPAPDGSGKYMLVDGDHRFTAAEEAGLETIKVEITNETDEQAYESQYIANFHRIATKPAEYGAQLQRILARTPTLTADELAAKLGLPPATIKLRLKLADLHADIATLVDAGAITLSNAVALSALSHEDQLNFSDRARSMATAEFSSLVNERVKEVRKAAREGRAANPVSKEFSAQPHLRKLGDIKAARENDAIISTIPGVSDVASAKAAIDWVMSMDAVTVAEAKAAYEAKQKATEDAKAKIESERAAKKLEEQERKLAELRAKAAQTAK